MAGNVMKSLAGSLIADDGTCATGAVPVYDSNGALPVLAPSRPSAGLGGAVLRVPLFHGRNEGGLVVTATASSANFALTMTSGTSLVLLSNAANGGTVTNKINFEITVPQLYKAGDNITVTVNSQYTLNGGTIGAKTIAALAYLLADAGTEGSNLIATSAQTVLTTAADYTFVITGTTLVPGSRLQLQIVGVVVDSASGLPTIQVNSVRLS